MALPLETEPRDLLLDADGDLVITSDLQWSTGIEAVAQSCRIALQMFQGEWFLNLDAGIPYFDGILGSKPEIAIAVARDEFRNELLAVDGVLEVLKLNVSYVNATRTMRVVWQVSTALGDTPVNTLDIGDI